MTIIETMEPRRLGKAAVLAAAGGRPRDERRIVELGGTGTMVAVTRRSVSAAPGSRLVSTRTSSG
jgi:hypothetical protein